MTDASGAVILNARIAITQNGVNGEPRVVRSNTSGDYTASNLPAGTYMIQVSGKSFDTLSIHDVILNVAQIRAVNARLTVGSENQTVTVTDNQVAVDTQSSSQAGTISGTQVRELELVNRNFQSLVTLQPGVVNLLGDEPGFGGLNSVSTLSINGARASANNWTVDGADINDSGSNTTLTNIPSIDAIQEFTMERSSYDASFGRSGGGQVLVATRSGTSALHGTVYEFVRTEKTDANAYFNKLGGLPRQPDHYNNFGFTLGGPVFIPHVYNRARAKTFFFWSEEWRKVTIPQINNVAAPTQGELNGTFFSTTQPNAPTGCVTRWTPFNPNSLTGGVGTINPNCYSANAKVYLSQIFDKFRANSISSNPATGFTGGSLITQYPQLSNFRQDLVRIDHSFSDKLHFFARGMEDDAPSNLPTGLFGGTNYPGVVNVGVNAPGKNVVGNLTWTISPKMVNELEFVYAQGTITGILNGPGNDPSVLSALTNNLASPDPYGRIPSVAILDGSVNGVSQGAAPYKERNLDRSLFDNFTITLGNHTLHVGVTFQQMLKTENGGGGNATFSFNGWGDFLLGNAAQYKQGNRDVVPDLQFWNTEAYVQDDWRATHSLTINLGVRWSHFPSPTDAKGTLNNFDSDLYQPALAPALGPDGNFVPGQMYTPATYANGLIFPQGSACTTAKAISPQVSCSPFGSLVNPNINRAFAPRGGFAYTPFANGKTVLRGGFGVFYDRTLDGIWEQNAFANPPLVQTTTISNASFDNPLQTGAVVPNYAPNPLTTTGTPTFNVPSYTNYNLSMQEQLSSSTVFEMAYVGSVSRHLLGEMDLNIPTLATREANPNLPLNNIRPYLGYANFSARLPIFTGNYNSLQVSVNHQARDLTAGAAYTWSKNMSDQSNDRGNGAYGSAASYAYDPKLDYGPSELNEPQLFVASLVYRAPFSREQHGLTGHILGGWEISGIFNFKSGLSTNVYQRTDPFACIPDAVNPNVCAAGTALGITLGGLGIQGPNFDVFSRADQVAPIRMIKTRTQWFSTSSFAPAVGHFGTTRVGNFLTPGMEKIDAGLMKNVRFAEGINLQLRAEAFNLFNHTNFGNNQVGGLSGIDTGLGDPLFGQATAAFEPRKMQFSGKLYF